MVPPAIGLSTRPGVDNPERCPLENAHASRTPLPHHPGMKPCKSCPMPQEQGSSTARERRSCGSAFQGKPFGVHVLFHLEANSPSESTVRGVFYISRSYCRILAQIEKYHLLTKHNSTTASRWAEIGYSVFMEQNSREFMYKMLLVSRGSCP